MEETKLQKIAEAIPTPVNLQPGNIWSNIFMATTTQTMTQTNIQDPPSLIEKTAAGQPSNNPGPPGEEAAREQQTHSNPLLGPLKEGIWVEEGGILGVHPQGEILREIPPLMLIKWQDRHLLFSKGIDVSLRHSFRNGISIEG